MKKTYIFLGAIVIIVALTLAIVNYYNKDSLKFKNAYVDADSTIKMEIDSNNPIKYINVKEAIDIIKNKTGVIYFGFPTCPWCRNAVPVLFDAAKESKFDTIYYLDMQKTRNDKDGLKQITDLLANHLDTNESGEKTLYVPDVYFIKNGNIKGHHLGSAPSQTDPNVALNPDQVTELKNIYLNLFKEMK